MLTKTTIALSAALIAISATAGEAAPRKKRTTVSAQTRAPAAMYSDPVNSNAVWEGGRYRGEDPDPNIRAQLRRNTGTSN